MKDLSGFREQWLNSDKNLYKDCTLDELTQIAMDAVFNKIESKHSMVLGMGRLGFIDYLNGLLKSLGLDGLSKETRELYEAKLPDTFYILKGIGVNVGGVYYEDISVLLKDYCDDNKEE